MTALWRALVLATGLGAAASLPAAAVSLPDAGTKNFTPPSQTPSYLMDESGKTRGGRDEAPTTESRSTEEGEPAAAATPEPSTAAVSHAQAGKHGRASRLAKARGGHGGRYAHGSRGRGNSRVAAARGHRSRSHATPQAHATTHAAARTRTGSSGKTRTAKPQTAGRQAAAFGRRRSPLDSA